MKVPVIQKPEFTIYIEQQQVPFLHCDVKRWSPSVRKALRSDVDTLFSLHGGPWFAVNEPKGCKKHQKFMQCMGFTYFGEYGGSTVFRRK